MKIQSSIILILAVAVIGGIALSQGWINLSGSNETDNSSNLSSPPPETGIVKRIVDPITIELDSGYIIRYIGVRTPNVAENVQCFGKEALLANESVIGRTVRLEVEPLLERSNDGAWTRYVFLHPEEDTSSEQPNVSPSPAGDAASDSDVQKVDSIAPDLTALTDSAKNVLVPEEGVMNDGNTTMTTEENLEESENNSDDNKPSAPEEIFINERILEGGFGFPVVSQDMKYGERMLSAAKFSSATGKGLWSRCEISNDNNVFNTQEIDSCTIKGKVSADGEKLYRTQECKGYQQTMVIQSEGGQWFCAEDLAEDAGFTKAPDCS